MLRHGSSNQRISMDRGVGKRYVTERTLGQYHEHGHHVQTHIVLILTESAATADGRVPGDECAVIGGRILVEGRVA